jgi:hypothetical protein
MTDEQTRTLVFTNEAGDYFLLSQASIERGRVPEEHKAEIDGLIAEAGGDVSGYVATVTYSLLRAINAGATAMGNFFEDVAAAQLLEEIKGGGSSGPAPAGQT